MMYSLFVQKHKATAEFAFEQSLCEASAANTTTRTCTGTGYFKPTIAAATSYPNQPVLH